MVSVIDRMHSGSIPRIALISPSDYPLKLFRCVDFGVAVLKSVDKSSVLSQGRIIEPHGTTTKQAS